MMFIRARTKEARLLFFGAIVAGVLRLPLAAICSFPAAAAHDNGAKTRIIKFPPQGLGYYFLSEPDNFMVAWKSKTKVTAAKGNVRVPVDADVTLATGWDRDANLPLLKALRPDDIQTLDLMGSAITHASFKYICTLKGLRSIIMTGTSIDDSDISSVATKLPELRQLDIGYTGVSDLCLPSLLRLKHLTSLSLVKDKIGDSGIQRLIEMPSLKALDLSDTQTTDAGLLGMRPGSGIMALNLSRTRITDRGLHQLLGMPSLRKLDLTGTSVDDKTMSGIVGKFEMLEELNLSQTHVGDEGIESLRALKNLRKLWLRDLKNVTDASVSALCQHVQLQDLEIQKTSIDAGGVQELAKKLPRSEIHSKAQCRCRKRERVN